MDAESAEHKGTLAPEHPSLSVVSRAPMSAKSVCCAEHFCYWLETLPVAVLFHLMAVCKTKAIFIMAK